MSDVGDLSGCNCLCPNFIVYIGLDAIERCDPSDPAPRPVLIELHCFIVSERWCGEMYNNYHLMIQELSTR